MSALAAAVTGQAQARGLGFNIEGGELREALEADARFDVIDSPSGYPDTQKWVRLRRAV